MSRALSHGVADFLDGHRSLWALSEDQLAEAREEILLRLVLGEYISPHDCENVAPACHACRRDSEKKAKWQEQLLDVEAMRLVGRKAAKVINFGVPAGLRPDAITDAQRRGVAIHKALEGYSQPGSDDHVDATRYLEWARKVGLLVAAFALFVGACGDSAGLPIPEAADPPAVAAPDLGRACGLCGCGERPYVAPDNCPTRDGGAP